MNKKDIAYLYILAKKFNPKLAEHIKIIYIKLKNPTKMYITFIYDNIHKINKRETYLNIISTFQLLKLREEYSDEPFNRDYKNKLVETIRDAKNRRKFKNLTECVGKYCCQ